MIIDSIEKASLYYGLSSGLDQGLDLIRRADLIRLAEGKYTCEGSGVYYTVQNTRLCPHEQTRWEHHTKHVDIQYALTDGEMISWLPTHDILQWRPMDEGLDVAFSHSSRTGYRFALPRGTFAIFFPTDAHRPCIMANEAQTSKKVVVKVPI